MGAWFEMHFRSLPVEKIKQSHGVRRVNAVWCHRGVDGVYGLLCVVF